MYLSKVIKVVLLLSLLALVVPAAIARGQTTGTATVRDSSPTLSDQIVIALSDLPAIGDFEVYEGWLVSDNGSEKHSLGILLLDDNGRVSHTYTHPDGVNLASKYDKFVVTVEPLPDLNPNPSDKVVASDRIPSAGIVHIRHLLFSGTGNPEYTSGPHAGLPKGITVGLWEQTNVALTHAGQASRSGALAEVKQHAESVINVIEGSSGAHYGDLDGNGTVEDAGDGFGVLNYAADARKYAELTVQAAPNDTAFSTFAPQVSESSDNAGAWAGLARDMALNALRSNSTGAAQTFITNAQILLGRALNGYDADRSGTIASGGEEGGAVQAHWGAQSMGRYDIGGVETPSTGDINYGLFAVIALVAGAVLFSGSGVLFLRKRTQS